MGRAGYLLTHFKAVTAAELTRRRALRAALESSLVGRKGGRVLVIAVRRHLVEFHGAGYSGLAIIDVVRACRGIAKWRGGGRRTVLLGVVLQKPNARQLAARWERRLERAGLSDEPTPIRRISETDGMDGTPENPIYQAGLMVRSGGVWRQTIDHSITMLTADTRNGDGSRGRIRRHVTYFERLRKAVARAILTSRERVAVEVILAGGRRHQVGQALGLRSMASVHKVVTELHRKLRVRGPGNGR